MKENANIFLKNDFYEKASESKRDTVCLFKSIVEVSTLNEYTELFYKAFCTLLESNRLFKDEQTIVEVILEYFETSNKQFPSVLYLKSMDYKPLTELEYSKISIQNFIKSPWRVEMLVEQLILMRSANEFVEHNKKELILLSEYNSMPTNFIYTIEDFKNSTFPFNLDNMKVELSYYCETQNKSNISSSLKFIDDNFGKLKSGSLNCLIKNDYSDDFFEISLLYNSILKEGKNVMYISPKWSSTDITKKLLALHSNTLDNSLRLDYTKLCKNSEDIEKVDKVLSDFKEKIGTKLYLVDNTSLKVFNIETLRKLLLGVIQKFISETSKGLELLIIDSLENFRLEKDGTIEASKQKIIQTYCNFIIRQTEICFRKGFGDFTTLVSTKNCNKNTFEEIKTLGTIQRYTTGIETINSTLEKYANKVYMFLLEKKNRDDKKIDGHIQIIKNSENRQMDEALEIEVSFINCSINVKEQSDNSETSISKTSISTVENKSSASDLTNFENDTLHIDSNKSLQEQLQQ